MRLPIDPALGDLLIDIERHGFVAAQPRFAPLANGEWSDVDVSRFAGAPIEITSSGALRVALQCNTLDDMSTLADLMNVRNSAATLTLADEHEITAELVNLRGIDSAGNLMLHRWCWAPKEDVRFWVGELHGDLPRDGNLGLQETTTAKRRDGSDETRCWTGTVGFRLQGAATWHVLVAKDSDAHYVVIDPGPDNCSCADLSGDLTCIEFAFGTPLRLGPLVGITEARDTVSAMSVGHYHRRAGGDRCPVSDSYESRAQLVPLFFTAVRRAMTKDGWEPLILGIAAYLDSVGDHLDGGYLKAQVGLEAFANAVSGTGEREYLVDDPDAWRRCVRRLRPRIRELLRDGTNVDTVMGKLSSAINAPTGQLVRTVLARHGIDLPQDVAKEVKRRNYAAHGFIMNSALDAHEFDRDVRRLEIIQTLITALVAIHVGYGGPIVGYDVAAGGRRPSPDWWPETPAGELDHFHYARDSR